MKVSIIIVNYKTAPLVRDCIGSVISMTKNISYEIIVVDNHSEDNIKETIQKHFGDKVKLLLLDKNIGFGRANNEGIKIATGEYLLFLNPDTLLLNNAIKILCDTMDENVNIGACGGNLYDEEMNPTLSFRRLFPGIRWELFEITAHRIENIIYRGNWMFNHTEKPLEVAYITGADLIVRRNVIKEVGPFSSLFFMYCEDTDLCLRIHRANYKILSIPDAKIQHLEGRSSKDNLKNISEKGLFLSEQGRQIYYLNNVRPIKRYIANRIYNLSLHLLYFISKCSSHHNEQAFKYRIHINNNL